MEVVVTSEEMIKPSSPTPKHLRRLQLSFFDQINIRIYTRFIYFYPSSSPSSQSTNDRLKKSLEMALSMFYPLAGRFKEGGSGNDDDFNFCVDCNDEGALYVQAKAKFPLSQVVAESNLAEFNKLLPLRQLDKMNGGAGIVPMGIQATFFTCGGLVISACFFHNVADALSSAIFVKCWADIARGTDKGNLISPRFDLATVFPPSTNKTIHKQPVKKDVEKIVGRSFLFTASAMSALRAKYVWSTTRPSRVEVISVFIFSRYVATTTNSGKRYVLCQSVNLRARMNPPLPNSYFGNFVGFAMVTLDSTNASGKGSIMGNNDLVTQLRNAVKRIDGEYIKGLVNNQSLSSFDGHGVGDRGKAASSISTVRGGGGDERLVSFSFSSVTSFPFFEADFGWGKPIRVSTSQEVNNMVNLAPTPSGEDIEALIFLKEEDMARLEADEEFLAYVAPRPISGSKVQFPSSL